MNQEEDPKRIQELIISGKLFSQKQVLKMWPISRRFLSRLTNEIREDRRLPSFKFGKVKLYSYDELQWFKEKMRYDPCTNRKRKAKNDN
jgi:hypothetical protein